MKIKELIELLQKEDPEMKVVVNGYESGYDEVEKIYCKPITVNENQNWWDGEYDSDIDQKGNLIALVIPRKS